MLTSTSPQVSDIGVVVFEGAVACNMGCKQVRERVRYSGGRWNEGLDGAISKISADCIRIIILHSFLSLCDRIWAARHSTVAYRRS